MGARKTASKGASADTTRRLISAGWDLIDEVGLLEALDTISVADVARRAERSERTFWNHFATWDSYVEALVSNIPRRGPMEETDAYGAVQAVDEALVPGSRKLLPELARAAAEGNWGEVTRPEELKAFRRQLLLASRADGDNRLTEVLGRDYYGAYLPRLQRIYEETGAHTRTEPIAPFDHEDFTRILAALSEGLLIQYIADPERTTVRFVADATVAVALSLLTPQEEPGSIEDIEAHMGAFGGSLEADPRMTTWAVACKELAERRDEPIGWGDVARATGVARIDLVSSLQRLEVLGSLVFGEFMAEATEAFREVRGSTEPHRSEDHGDSNGPLLSVTNWLCELARTARMHPWGARCLLQERLKPGEDAATIAQMVPLGGAISDLLDEHPRSVHDRMVNITLAAALSDNSAAPAEIAHSATELHPDLRSETQARSSD